MSPRPPEPEPTLATSAFLLVAYERLTAAVRTMLVALDAYAAGQQVEADAVWLEIDEALAHVESEAARQPATTDAAAALTHGDVELFAALHAAGHDPRARLAVLRVEIALGGRPGLDLERGVYTDETYRSAVRKTAAALAAAGAVDQLIQLAASVDKGTGLHRPEALA